MNITALGIATLNSKQKCIEVFYNWISVKAETYEKVTRKYEQKDNFQIKLDSSKADIRSLDYLLEPNIPLQPLFRHQTFILIGMVEDNPIETVPEAYLKLHLLSKRIYKPNELNLENLFPTLPNLCWTNQGAIDVEEIESKQMQYRCNGEILHVRSVDKFPQMLDYVLPSDVRIANSAKVRLGAYLGKGTTVMHTGFVNFNAGTEGPNMVEGRISAGVFVGSGTHLGGSCSTMGTLSGGGKAIISIGRDCLIGANGGVGIALGDRCVIESGLYITAGSKVVVLDSKNNPLKEVKAKELAQKDDLLFRRNSLSGKIECIASKGDFQLNADLHNNLA